MNKKTRYNLRPPLLLLPTKEKEEEAKKSRDLTLQCCWNNNKKNKNEEREEGQAIRRQRVKWLASNYTNSTEKEGRKKERELARMESVVSN